MLLQEPDKRYQLTHPSNAKRNHRLAKTGSVIIMHTKGTQLGSPRMAPRALAGAVPGSPDPRSFKSLAPADIIAQVQQLVEENQRNTDAMAGLLAQLALDTPAMAPPRNTNKADTLKFHLPSSTIEF